MACSPGVNPLTASAILTPEEAGESLAVPMLLPLAPVSATVTDWTGDAPVAGAGCLAPQASVAAASGAEKTRVVVMTENIAQRRLESMGHNPQSHLGDAHCRSSSARWAERVRVATSGLTQAGRPATRSLPCDAVRPFYS